VGKKIPRAESQKIMRGGSSKNVDYETGKSSAKLKNQEGVKKKVLICNEEI